MGKIKNLLRNKWVGFTLAALLYTLWFVVWTGNLWLLLGLPVIFDLYITKFFYRYVWSHNVKMCQRSKTYRTVYEWVNAIIFATVVATLVHLFIFQMYVIPTSSMERTLLIGPTTASRGSSRYAATTWWSSTSRRATRCCSKTRT